MTKPTNRRTSAVKPGKITPLWIVATFLTLTETVLGIALTQVTGGVQNALTTFVIIFAFLVAIGFFVILWNRPYVFYSPAEYGNVDPRHFADAMRTGIPEQLAARFKAAEAKPGDNKAQFALIDSLIDEPLRQHAIVMHEKNAEIPYHAPFAFFNYEIGGARSWASGSLSGEDIYKRMKGTGLIEVNLDGPAVKLSESGREFAKWLVESGKKAAFFHSSLGGWGERVLPAGMPEGFASPMPTGPFRPSASRRPSPVQTETASPAGPANQSSDAPAVEDPPQ